MWDELKERGEVVACKEEEEDGAGYGKGGEDREWDGHDR